jgi:nucleotide-binding universal stress UspA family protein
MMSIAHIAAAGALALSIATSTALDRFGSAAEPPRYGAFHVVIADLHVHAFPGDGGLPPWDIRREARRRGIDVVAIANHNHAVALRLDRALFTPPTRPLVLAAEETTSSRYHLISLGIRESIDWRLSLADAIRAIHAQGGVAIAAHPIDDFGPFDDDVLRMLDGLEVAHPIGHYDAVARAQLEALYERARRVKPTIAPIGSSDYHFGAPIGFSHTRLLVGDLSAEGVLDAIRAGRAVAYAPGGRSYGSAEWVDAVSKAPAAAPRNADSAGHNLAMIGAWLSLVILVVFGGRQVK